MRKLIVFELKKIFEIKYLKLFIGVLLVVNVINIVTNYDLLIKPTEYIINSEPCRMDEVRYIISREYEGEITADKVEAMRNHISQCRIAQDGGFTEEKLYYPLAYTDTVEFQVFVDEMERLYSYNNEKISLLMDYNHELYEEALQNNDIYSQRTTKLVEKAYSNRDINNFYRVNEFQPLFEYKLSSLCLLLIACFVAAFLFSGEKEKAMNSMIRCTQSGKGRIFAAKISALVIFCILICLFFSLSDFILFCICRRPTGFFEPVYALKAYAYSPLNISVIDFYLLQIFFRLIGVFSVSVSGLVFSAIFRKSYISFLSTVFVAAGFMYSGLFTDGVFSVLRYFNPISLITSVNLTGNFAVVNMFGFPVYAYLAALLGVVILTAFLCFAVYRLSVRRLPSNA